MTNDFGTTTKLNATLGASKAGPGVGGDLPTMPDPSKDDPEGGEHLPTMPDPTHEPESGQQLPTDPEPGAKPPARIDDPPRTHDEEKRWA